MPYNICIQLHDLSDCTNRGTVAGKEHQIVESFLVVSDWIRQFRVGPGPMSHNCSTSFFDYGRDFYSSCVWISPKTRTIQYEHSFVVMLSQR